MIYEMTAAQRLEIKLRYQAGEVAQQIADTLGLPVADVDSQIRFARKQGAFRAQPTTSPVLTLEELAIWHERRAKSLPRSHPSFSDFHAQAARLVRDAMDNTPRLDNLPGHIQIGTAPPDQKLPEPFKHQDHPEALKADTFMNALDRFTIKHKGPQS